MTRQRFVGKVLVATFMVKVTGRPWSKFVSGP